MSSSHLTYPLNLWWMFLWHRYSPPPPPTQHCLLGKEGKRAISSPSITGWKWLGWLIRQPGTLDYTSILVYINDNVNPRLYSPSWHYLHSIIIKKIVLFDSKTFIQLSWPKMLDKAPQPPAPLNFKVIRQFYVFWRLLTILFKAQCLGFRWPWPQSIFHEFTEPSVSSKLKGSR